MEMVEKGDDQIDGGMAGEKASYVALLPSWQYYQHWISYIFTYVAQNRGLLLIPKNLLLRNGSSHSKMPRL